jgi:hypothetical protein
MPGSNGSQIGLTMIAVDGVGSVISLGTLLCAASIKSGAFAKADCSAAGL